MYIYAHSFAIRQHFRYRNATLTNTLYLTNQLFSPYLPFTMLVIFVSIGDNSKPMYCGFYNPTSGQLRTGPFTPSPYRGVFRHLLNCRNLHYFSVSDEPTTGLEPVTFFLQGRCSTNWATSAYVEAGEFESPSGVFCAGRVNTPSKPFSPPMFQRYEI